MPNSILQTWVKNVYDLRILRGMTGGYISTASVYSMSFPTTNSEKVGKTSHKTHTFPMRFSTRFFVQVPLLKWRLYPFSTGPTITKTMKINKK